MISILQLGTVDYATGLGLQQRLVSLRKEGKIGDVVLLLEHQPVITLGRNAKAGNVLASPELLKQRGVELFACDRGGDVTFHGPGQLVGYPIFDLRGHSPSPAMSSRANRSEIDGESSARPEQAAEESASKGGSVFCLTREGEGQDFSRSPRSGGTEAASAAAYARKHLGAVDFVRRLEEALIRTCADFAIAAKRIPGLTGVWTDADAGQNHGETAAPGCRVERSSTAVADTPPELRREPNREGHDCGRAVQQRKNLAASAAEEREAKLAAIGIHISRFVTSHGFALNINPDLSYFNLIIPCGITSKPVTSMQRELGRALDLNAVAQSISRNFGVVFQTQMLWLDSIADLVGHSTGVPMPAPESLRRRQEEDDSARA